MKRRLIAVAGLVTACGDASGPGGTAELPTGAWLVMSEYPSLTLPVGARYTVDARAETTWVALPGVRLSYTITDRSVATVDAGGTIRALAPGRSWVVARAGQLADSVPLLVTPAEPRFEGTYGDYCMDSGDWVYQFVKVDSVELCRVYTSPISGRSAFAWDDGSYELAGRTAVVRFPAGADTLHFSQGWDSVRVVSPRLAAPGGPPVVRTLLFAPRRIAASLVLSAPEARVGDIVVIGAVLRDAAGEIVFQSDDVVFDQLMLNVADDGVLGYAPGGEPGLRALRAGSTTVRVTSMGAQGTVLVRVVAP